MGERAAGVSSVRPERDGVAGIELLICIPTRPSGRSNAFSQRAPEPVPPRPPAPFPHPSMLPSPRPSPPHRQARSPCRPTLPSGPAGRRRWRSPPSLPANGSRRCGNALAVRPTRSRERGLPLVPATEGQFCDYRLLPPSATAPHPTAFSSPASVARGSAPPTYCTATETAARRGPQAYVL